VTDTPASGSPHRAAAVNVDRIAEVRRRENGRDWELRLEPPVNSVLPIGRTRLAALWAAFSEGAP
jgi:DNA-binding LytR/AlgR family response regulator